MPRESIILTLRDDDLKLRGLSPDKIDLELFEKISDEIAESANDRWAADLTAAINTVLGDDLSKYELTEKDKFSTYLVNWQWVEANRSIRVKKLTFSSATEKTAYIRGANECDRYAGEDFEFFHTLKAAMNKAKEIKDDMPLPKDIEIEIDLN